MPPSQNSAELLRRLLDAEVELVVVGGIAIKAFVGRPKDRLVEAELRAIRDRINAG